MTTVCVRSARSGGAARRRTHALSGSVMRFASERAAWTSAAAFAADSRAAAHSGRSLGLSQVHSPLASRQSRLAPRSKCARRIAAARFASGIASSNEPDATRIVRVIWAEPPCSQHVTLHAPYDANNIARLDRMRANSLCERRLRRRRARAYPKPPSTHPQGGSISPRAGPIERAPTRGNPAPHPHPSPKPSRGPLRAGPIHLVVELRVGSAPRPGRSGPPRRVRGAREARRHGIRRRRARGGGWRSWRESGVYGVVPCGPWARGARSAGSGLRALAGGTDGGPRRYRLVTPRAGPTATFVRLSRRSRACARCRAPWAVLPTSWPRFSERITGDSRCPPRGTLPRVSCVFQHDATPGEGCAGVLPTPSWCA